MSDTSLLFISYTCHLPPAVTALPSQPGPLNWCLPAAEIVSQSQTGQPKHSIDMNKIYLWHYTRSTPGPPPPQWANEVQVVGGVVGAVMGVSGCFGEVTPCKVTPQECWLSLLGSKHCKYWDALFMKYSSGVRKRRSTDFYPRKTEPLASLCYNLALSAAHAAYAGLNQRLVRQVNKQPHGPARL